MSSQALNHLTLHVKERNDEEMREMTHFRRFIFYYEGMGVRFGLHGAGVTFSSSQSLRVPGALSIRVIGWPITCGRSILIRQVS